LSQNIERVAVPSTEQVLSELLVSQLFSAEWLRRSLTGATFTKIPIVTANRPSVGIG
jgi:hypothetical protein